MGRLVLVDPLSYSFEKAEKLAVGAEDVIAKMGLEKDLPSALGECVLAVGTSSRQLSKRPSLLPDEVASVILGARGPVALLFGDEKRGLSDEDLSHCQAVCRIPTAAAQPSLNLAQATGVMGYALARSSLQTPARETAPGDAAELATLAERAELRALLEALLLEAGFLNPQNPDNILTELLRPLESSGLERRELLLWKTALKKLARLSGRRSAP
jgi:tRNA/rRNA methyltransferase